MKECEKLNPQQVIDKLIAITKMMESAKSNDWWLSEEGQKRLQDMDKERSATHQGSLNIFDYSTASKASLCPMTSPSEEWFEVELTADTGACDTVIPKAMCPKIPITPSFQSINGLEYEFATGASIPNLGEKKCEMWTEGASAAKTINMQVADVHKALLSLSRCADMGFESRFGKLMGCLIDTELGEVIPLQRRGNLYVLRCWIRAAPFCRPDGKP